MKFIFIPFIILLSSCTQQQVPEVVQAVNHINAEALCTSDWYIWQYNKYIKDWDMITCYQTEPNGRVIKEMKFITF